MKTKIPLLLLFVLLVTHSGQSQAMGHHHHLEMMRQPLELKDFSTDGCSAYPDGYFYYDPSRWVHCCITHDMAYWVGGTKEEKSQADSKLNQCVTEATNQFHGNIMEVGVAIGGAPRTPFSWRWGYGWNRITSYKNLTPQDKDLVIEKFDSILHTLLDVKDWMSPRQRAYVLARYELLRHEAFEGKTREHEKETYEYRLHLIRELLE